LNELRQGFVNLVGKMAQLRRPRPAQLERSSQRGTIPGQALAARSPGPFLPPKSVAFFT
jgi:hypothetical protein